MMADPLKLIDHLLDARCALLAAQQGSTEGAPIFKAMQESIDGVDGALALARAIVKASAAA